ncbi:MAG: hypothetical protein MR508_00405 [Lachnospiraceae bacterium]|nr:hypothetical protein [Lachnospiraceae bacterium]
MKEVIRHYGSSVIAAMVGIFLMGLIAGLPYKALAGNPASEHVVAGEAFESYWRNP